MKHISEIIPEAIGHIRPLRHGSLFSGIGGFDLAAEWMGWENVFHCEWNEFGQKVLKYYWPKAETFTDITKSDFKKYNGTIDIISGGFPCQPYSSAGKRKGKEDERHLWPEMLRAIREIQPRWVLGENVRGLTNWNGGMVFDEVQAELEFEGYEVTPFLLPACAKNAPHRRDRIWFVAYANRNGHEYGRFGNDRHKEAESKSERLQRERLWDDNRGNGEQEFVANTGSQQLQERSQNRVTEDRKENGTRLDNRAERFGNIADATNTCSSVQQELHISQFSNGKKQLDRRIDEERSNWNNFPTQSPLCSRNDGISTELSGITFFKHRNESIKAYGNAVVPQIPFEIFKAIQAFEAMHIEPKVERSVATMPNR